MSSAVGFHTHSANKRKWNVFSRNNFMEGTADDYANGGKRDKNASGSGTGMGSSILARSRAAGAGVTVPQCTVNLTSVVAKNEKQLRALACRGDPNDLYGKPAANEATFNVHKGQIVLHRRKVGGSFRTNAAAESNIECLGTMNGVSISNTRLFGVAVAQVESYPMDKGSNNQTATTWHGVQTVTNYSDQRWNAGDLLIADPYPITVRAQNGEMKPVVYGPEGVTEEALNIVLRPWSGAHLSHLVNHCEDLIRLQLGDSKILLQLQAATTSADMLAILHALCDKIFATEMVAAPDSPLRGYAVIWAADRLLDMIQVDWRSMKSAATHQDMTEKEYGNYMRLSMLAKLQAVIDVEDKFIGITNEYAASLPHTGDHVDSTTSNVRARSTLRSKHLMELVSKSNTEDRSRCMMEFAARVKMHADHAKAQFIDRLRVYFGSLYAGVCLSSADKGQSADLFVGKAA